MPVKVKKAKKRKASPTVYHIEYNGYDNSGKRWFKWISVRADTPKLADHIGSALLAMKINKPVYGVCARRLTVAEAEKERAELIDATRTLDEVLSREVV